MEINEHWIKVGKLPVRVPVPLGATTFLNIPGEEEAYQLECVKVEEKDNNDGTKDVTYILKHSP